MWTEECEQSFVELKQKLISAPILSYPLPEDNYILDTDASGYALGAVLSQIQDGTEKVIGYASRSLNKAENNYCVTRRELLAVVFALKHFKPYVFGRAVTVRTDHGALRWLTNFKDPEGQLARWLETISQYHVTLVHRPGRQHGNADGLSRKCQQCGRDECRDINQMTAEAEKLGEMTIEIAGSQHITGSESENEESETKISEIEELTVNDKNNADDGRKLGQIRVIAIEAEITLEELREAQLKESGMGQILTALEQNSERPVWKKISGLSPEFKMYVSQWKQLEVRQGVLCRKWESDNGKQVEYKVVLPKKFRKIVLTELHESKTAGHLGVRKTKEKVQSIYYWVGLSQDVRAFVRLCSLCTRRKSLKNRRSPLQQYMVGAPLERIAMDILGPLPITERGNKYILVIGDYFTKWVEAYPIPDQTAETVAKKVVEEFICRFGVPRELHSDQGRNFESKYYG